MRSTNSQTITCIGTETMTIPTIAPGLPSKTRKPANVAVSNVTIPQNSAIENFIAFTSASIHRRKPTIPQTTPCTSIQPHTDSKIQPAERTSRKRFFAGCSARHFSRTRGTPKSDSLLRYSVEKPAFRLQQFSVPTLYQTPKVKHHQPAKLPSNHIVHK